MLSDTRQTPFDRPGAHRLTLRAEPYAVRSAVCQVTADLGITPTGASLVETIEIVLSEVLNNIVEHAYRGDPGPIDIALWPHDQGGLVCQVIDRGEPMPGSEVPGGELPRLSPGTLPEGGFGWPLIRALTCDIHYTRQDGQNRLSFRVMA